MEARDDFQLSANKRCLSAPDATSLHPEPLSIFSERFEPLSRVFNDQPRNIYMAMYDRTYVSNTHAHERWSILR